MSINEKKFKRVTYIELQKNKDWMDKNLKPQEQSAFIRGAVQTRIEITTKKK